MIEFTDINSLISKPSFTVDSLVGVDGGRHAFRKTYVDGSVEYFSGVTQHSEGKTIVTDIREYE